MVANGEKLGEVAKISKRFINSWILDGLIIRFKGEIPAKLRNFGVKMSNRGMEPYIIIAGTSFSHK